MAQASTAGTSTESSLIPTDPFTVHTVEYDFENYALEHGIPETLDPLPYRKAGSVFATGEEAEPVLTSAKHDPRLRTVVCRHWLRDLCMKGSACEFLHQYDLSKMPLCRHGERCKIHDCPFRHISEANRLECVFYSQGFCIHGPFCRYKHVRREHIDLPAVADFTLGLSQMQASAGGKDGAGAVSTRRPAPKPNEFYKISLCKHFLQGDCPFGDGCHFAHGEAELRQFPRPGQPGAGGGQQKQGGGYEDENQGNELSDNMFGDGTHINNPSSSVDYFQGGASGGGKPSPILEPEYAHFFIIRAATQTDLAISTVFQEWYVERKHAEQLNACMDGTNSKRPPSSSSSSGNNQSASTAPAPSPKVLLFFTVSDSRHIQGAALLTGQAQYVGDQHPHMSSKKKNANDPTFEYKIPIEWYRTTELPVATAKEAAPDLILPSPSTELCQEMSWKTGEALMKAVWNAPLVTLYEAWSPEEYDYDDDDDDMDANAEMNNPSMDPNDPNNQQYHGKKRKRDQNKKTKESNYRPPPAREAWLTDFRCPPLMDVPTSRHHNRKQRQRQRQQQNQGNNNDDDYRLRQLPIPRIVPWPVMPGPGFIFGCSSDTMDECLGRGLFGLPAHMKSAAKWIVPGSCIFLFNVTDRLLFGIFEALTPAMLNLDPMAFNKNIKQSQIHPVSPFPVQVRVRVGLECPPLEDTDVVLNDILRSRGASGRIGSLTFAQTEAIASLLASQCGALSYMTEYQQGIRRGGGGASSAVNPPPIALPPRKIKSQPQQQQQKALSSSLVPPPSSAQMCTIINNDNENKMKYKR